MRTVLLQRGQTPCRVRPPSRPLPGWWAWRSPAGWRSSQFAEVVGPVEILGPNRDTICGPRPLGNGDFSCHIGYSGYSGYAYTILVSDQTGTGAGDDDIDVYR
jgi:hypothetical protein